jgi:hypothetical protein
VLLDCVLNCPAQAEADFGKTFAHWQTKTLQQTPSQLGAQPSTKTPVAFAGLRLWVVNNSFAATALLLVPA